MAVHLIYVGAGIYLFLYISRWFFTRKWIDVSRDLNLASKKLTGKIVVITGGNTGLGKDVASDLAKRGAIVIIACRNREQGEETARKINKISIKQFWYLKH